jgi:hypothetical protein
VSALPDGNACACGLPQRAKYAVCRGKNRKLRNVRAGFGFQKRIVKRMKAVRAMLRLRGLTVLATTMRCLIHCESHTSCHALGVRNKAECQCQRRNSADQFPHFLYYTQGRPVPLDRCSAAIVQLTKYGQMTTHDRVKQTLAASSPGMQGAIGDGLAASSSPSSQRPLACICLST